MTDNADETSSTEASEIAAKPAMPKAAPKKSRAPQYDDWVGPDRPPIRVFGIPLPGPINRVCRTVQFAGSVLRHKALEIAPAIAVNNSSNIIAAMHLMAEMFMFKAPGNKLIQDHRKGNFLNYIIDPPRNVWKSVLGDSKSATFRWKHLLEPKWYGSALKELRDVEGATVKDLALLKEGQVLHNHWQARATLTGLTSWSLTFATPDYHEKEEDVEKMTEMSVKNPLLFAGTKLKQAVWYPFDTAIKLVKTIADPKHDHELGKNKGAFTGLGIVIYGIWSTLGAWRNTGKHPVGHPLAGKRHYYFNRSYLFTGMISIFAGLPLLFETNSERGWIGFGTHMQMRFPFLITSIRKQFKMGSPGVWWYTTAHSIFQTHNAIAALIGGAKKHRDGTVEDNGEEREAVRQQAFAEKDHQKKFGGEVDKTEPTVASDDAEKNAKSHEKTYHTKAEKKKEERTHDEPVAAHSRSKTDEHLTEAVNENKSSHGKLNHHLAKADNENTPSARISTGRTVERVSNHVASGRSND